MNDRFASGSLTLVGHLAGATSTGPVRPAVILVHGYPSAPAGAVGAMASIPALVDRIAEQMGMVAFAPSLRGLGESEGDYSLGGWLADIHAAIAHLRATTRVAGVWLVGFGTGGALAIAAGANDPEIRGVASMAAPADFEDVASNPKRIVDHARDAGVIRSARFPTSLETFAREFRSINAVRAAALLSPRPLLVVHGSADEVVPTLDARVIADAHAHAELRIIAGAAHRLRHDPRATATLLGWLDRQRNAETVRKASV